VGPRYVSPPIPLPAKWKNSQQVPSCPHAKNPSWVYLDNWWQVFEDTQLDCLEKWALSNNRDLVVACERVQEARALMGIAASSLFPQVNLTPQYTNTMELIKNYNLSSLNLPGLTSRAQSVFRAHELMYLLPLTVNYEVDLWGKLRDQYCAAKYSWLAQRKDFEAAMLSLTSSLATAYYQMRIADTQIELLAKIIEVLKRGVSINESRFKGEITFYADVAFSAESLAIVVGQYEEIIRQRSILENQIALMIGVAPTDFHLDPMPLYGLPPIIPEGIPSEALLRRPDIAEAAFNTRSQHALVKNAYAQFFPSLKLTATIGFESPVLRDFLRWISRYWMIGAQANQVIFDGGRLCSNLMLQIARFKETGAEYQQQVLIAFQEVEDALNNLNSFAQQYEAAVEATSWGKKNVQLFCDRYTTGLTYYIDVVNTEVDLFNFQITQNVLQGYRFLATIQLIKALGGGWSMPQECICQK